MIEIIPNWHPVFVHFAIGLLLVSAALFLIGSATRPPLAAKATTAARWNLWIGALFAVLSVFAGYLAFYTVAHDDPAHAAMLVHLKWAWISLVLFGAAAILAWRERMRESGAGLLLGVTLAAGSGALLTTGYLGAENVFRHGLGVQRLPAAEGPGHAHEHGGTGHAGESASSAETAGHSTDTAAGSSGHSHEHAASDAAAGDAHDHPPAGATSPGDAGSLSPAAKPAADAVDAFQQALASGDLERARSFLDPQVRIFESGNVERSAEEYASHHMHSDAAFLGKAEVRATARSGEASGDLAWIITESTITTAGEKPASIASIETMILRNGPDGWRIAHIHWSSR